MAEEVRSPVNLDDYAEGIWAKPVDLNRRRYRFLTFLLLLSASYFQGALPMFRVRDAIPEPSVILDLVESSSFPLLLIIGAVQGRVWWHCGLAGAAVLAANALGSEFT